MPVQMIARVVAVLAASALLLIAPFETAAQEPRTGEQPIELASVVIDGEVLFKVRGATSFPADARAAGIVERIEAVAANPEIDPATVRAVPVGEFIEIYAGPMRIMTVVPPDAETERLTVGTLAGIIVTRTKKAITEYRAARTSENLTASALRAIGALLAFAVATGGLLWLSRRLRTADRPRAPGARAERRHPVVRHRPRRARADGGAWR